MNTTYVITTMLVLTVMIFITRALPFFFGYVLKDNAQLRTIGKFLPGYIMVLLVLYEINPAKFLLWPYNLPAIIALLILTIIHIWRRQILLSIFIGVMAYFLCLSLF